MLHLACSNMVILCTVVAASNGSRESPESLHYIDMNRGQQNQYQRAIQAVGEIIQDYDSDKYFPVLGFGARLPPAYDTVSHLFFVNGDTTSPYCYKVRGESQYNCTVAYRNKMYVLCLRINKCNKCCWNHIELKSFFS